jgi:hypothetical protein
MLSALIFIFGGVLLVLRDAFVEVILREKEEI